jgi:hypothetical protein
VSEDPKGAISTEGRVVSPQTSLLSPCTQQPCLYFEVKIERLYEKTETTEEGTKTSKGSDTLDTVKSGTIFGLDDGSGVMMVDVSKGADFDNMKDGFKKEIGGGHSSSHVSFGSYTYDVPVLSGKEGRTIGFRATEKFVPVEGSLFVVGKLEGSTIVKPGWRSLVVSNKGREGLVGSVNKKKKMAFIAGGAAAALSIPLMVFGPKADPNAISHSCESSLTDARQRCGAKVSQKSGDQYTWTVTKAGEYELEVFAPKKKVPFAPEVLVKGANGEVLADASGGVGGNAKTSVKVEPGAYTVVVKPGDGYMVKGGFSYDFEIRSAEGAAKAQAGQPAAAPAALAWKTLDKLNVKLEVPADVEITDSTPEGQPQAAPSYSMFNESNFNVMVSATTDLDASSMDAMKKELALDPNKVRSYTRSEKTSDGWVLEWEADSMSEPGKTLYGVNVRKNLGGHGVSCSRNVDSKAIATAISTACQSMTAVNGVVPTKTKKVAGVPGKKHG